MSSTERLFYAIPLPASVRERLAEAVAGVSLPARLAPEENWHITLRFLGATPAELRRRVEDAVGRQRLPAPFSCRIDHWGAFPRPAAARVLWAGAGAGGAELSRLAAAVEQAARDAGFDPEIRPFRAHVTLARFRDPVNVRAALEELPEIAIQFPVEQFALFRSHLGGGPARYEAISRHPLPGSTSESQTGPSNGASIAPGPHPHHEEP